MTEEEINNLAEKHCNEVLCNAHEKCYEVIKCRDWRSRRAGFFCGYEQAVKDMQQENNKLLDVINGQDVKIADLEWQLQEVAKDNDYYQAENKRLEEQIEKMKQTEGKLKKARNIIKHLLIMLHEKELYGVYVSIAQDFMAEVEEEDADKTEESQDL